MSEYSGWEDRPRHPVTGAPADYFFEVTRVSDGRYETLRLPRWRDPFLKNPNPALCWYSVKEVAKLVGKDVQWVRKACREQRLPASKPVGSKDWFIRGDELLSFMSGQTKLAPIPEPVSEGERL
jgi:hypothetical protein